MNLDWSEASGPDCIPVVVLKNGDPELSYILVKLFNKCLKEVCFPECWFHRRSLYLRMWRKSLPLKITVLIVFFLWLVKVFEILINNRIVDHPEKSGLFSDFSGMVLGLFEQLQIFLQLYLINLLRLLTGLGYLSSSTCTVRLLTGHAGLLHNLKSSIISGQISDLISSFLSNRWLWVVLDEKSS